MSYSEYWKHVAHESCKKVIADVCVCFISNIDEEGVIYKLKNLFCKYL